MSTRAKVLTGVGIYFLVIVLALVIFGTGSGGDEEFAPQNEFRLDTWIGLPGPFDINKGVFFVVAAGLMATLSMLFVARKMEQRPNRIQTLVEFAYTGMRDNITRGNMDPSTAARWFPFIATLFFFVFWANLLGFVPLPTNTEHPVNIFGVEFPTFAIYAVTSNLSVPLTLAVIVFLSYNIEGIRQKGLVGYLKGLVPSGTKGFIAGFIFVLELFSNFLRLISLSVRLFANMLAGHLLILFMSGALVVLLGVEAVGVVTLPAGVVLYLFEVGLVVTLQAFIFATLTAIYLGGAVAEDH